MLKGWFYRLSKRNGFNLALWVVSVVVALTIVNAWAQAAEDVAADKATYTNLTAQQAWDYWTSDTYYLFIDVREQSEWNSGHIPDIPLYPWNSGYFAAHYTELPHIPIVVTCGSGGRSAQAAQMLVNNGYTDIFNMLGGFTAWKAIAPPPQEITHTNSFTSDTEGWSFAGAVGSFDQPQNSFVAGHIGLSAAGSTNCFSYWVSPDVPVENDQMYKATWTLNSDTADSTETVNFRLRVNQKEAWSSWGRIVNSAFDHAPSGGQNKAYQAFFTPRVITKGADSVQFSFDILSFEPGDDANGWLYLEELQLEKAYLKTAKPMVSYTFATGTEGWTFSGAVAPFASSATAVEPDRIGFSPNGCTNCFSYWYSPETLIADGKYYRALFEVSSSVNNADDAVTFRLRTNQTTTYEGWEYVVNSYDQQSPSSGGSRKYEIVFNPQVFCTCEDRVILSFDIASFDPKDDTNSWLYLESASLEEVTIVP